MNILLINLPRYNSVPVVREERCESLTKNRVDTPATLLIMAALLREMENEIDFIDANALNLSYEDILDRCMHRVFVHTLERRVKQKCSKRSTKYFFTRVPLIRLVGAREIKGN